LYPCCVVLRVLAFRLPGQIHVCCARCVCVCACVCACGVSWHRVIVSYVTEMLLVPYGYCSARLSHIGPIAWVAFELVHTSRVIAL
jgi:hypothetical protein